MSIVLPAVNGMITRIGLAGQLCAQLTRGSAGVMAAAAMSCRWRRRVCFKDVPPLIRHESKAARASCLTFSLLVVFVCQLKKSHRTKVRAHSLILPYQLPHRRIQPVERERIYPPRTYLKIV
jgi:hypothetical protein